MVLSEVGAPGPGVPRHQDVDDDQADGEDRQDSTHSDGDQHLQLTVLCRMMEIFSPSSQH